MTTSLTSLLRSLVVIAAFAVLVSANENLGTIAVDDLVAAGNVQPAPFATPYLSAAQLQSIAVTGKTVESDTMAGQVSSKGGSLYVQDGQHYLALLGVLEFAMVVKDPADHSSMRLVTHDAIVSTLPRFAVFVTNNTISHPLFNPKASEIPYKTLNLKEVVQLDVEQQYIVYRVEVINQDANNALGLSGVPSTDVDENFDSAMLMIDLTPFGGDGSIDAMTSTEASSTSLRYHLENAGKPSTLDVDGNEVGAQGVLFTWWLGPFMYFCCPYGFLTLPFVFINPFSLPWVFGFCCL